MKKIVSLVMAFIMTLMLAACGQETTDGENSVNTGDSTSSVSDISNIKIGAMVGSVKNDGGWSQAQYEGIVNAMTNLGMDVETQLIFLENIKEEQSVVQAAVDQLVIEGCNVIFGSSTSYAPILSELAPNYPDVLFAQAGDKMENIVCYQIRDYEAMFLCGYTMGLLSEEDMLGYCAGMSEASVRRGINAFSLGAKAANENAKVQVVWANSWHDIAKETECANTLINMGIEYIGVNASSPAIPEACEAAGVYCTGYHMDVKERAPKAVVTSFVWNWAPIMEDIITKYVDGTISTEDYYFWGTDKNCATIAPINTDIVKNQEVIDKVEAMREKISSGEYQVFAGELKDNQGNILVNEGEIMSDEKILSQEFLVENVIGEW